MPQSNPITAAPTGRAHDYFAEHGGRPQHTLSVVRSNADIYQGPREPSTCSKIAGALWKPIAVLAGAGITAGTTYALVKHVQHAIANASVSSDPNVWINKANSTYQNCYNGCSNDCDDTNFAFNACKTTAGVVVNGTLCDGNAMWNWLERYPMPCLQALGDTIKSHALTSAKQHERNELSIIILTVLAGVVGATVIYNTPRWLGCTGSRNAQERV